MTAHNAAGFAGEDEGYENRGDRDRGYNAEPPVTLRQQQLRRRPVVAPPVEEIVAEDDSGVELNEESAPTEPAAGNNDPVTENLSAIDDVVAPGGGEDTEPRPDAEQVGPVAYSQQQAAPGENPYGVGYVGAGGFSDAASIRAGAGYQYGAAGRVLVDPDPAAGRGRQGGRGMGLLDTVDGIEQDPAEWGWRGRLNALGFKIRPRPDSEEVAFRQAIEQVRQPLPGFWVVAVANVKGGMGKTPTTLMLSNTFGLYRGGGVVAWDSNESKGTLAERAAASMAANEYPPSVWDVLEHAAELAGPNAQAGALSHFLRKQPTMDEILASDQSSKRMKAIGRDECAAIMAVLRRHRNGVIIDTGNEDTSPNWQWAMEHAHQLVIPMPYRRDAAAKVTQMLDGLHARDLSALVSSAVVTLAPTPGGTDQDREAIINELRAVGVHRFEDMPYEPQFEGAGARIVYSRLPLETRVAYTHLAGEIANSLAHTKSPRGVEFDAGFVPQSISRPPEYDVRGTRTPMAAHAGYPVPAGYGPASGGFPAVSYPDQTGGWPVQQQTGGWPVQQQNPYYSPLGGQR